jgi:molybdopterin synthase sulfur carrier subunit
VTRSFQEELSAVSSQSTITVLIPTPLRHFTGGESRVSLSGTSVGEALDALEAAHPGIGERIRDDSGQIRRFVNVFVNGKNVRDADGIETTLAPGDELGIIPAMAGGARP